MTISSPAFEINKPLPVKYTCDGLGVSPPLEIFEVPAGAQSLVLIVTDPDAPTGEFTHWTLWNINPAFDGIPEGNVPEGATEGVTDSGEKGYFAPCPPSGVHRYFFRLYALSEKLTLREEATVDELQEAMETVVLDYAETNTIYSRS